MVQSDWYNNTVKVYKWRSLSTNYLKKPGKQFNKSRTNANTSNIYTLVYNEIKLVLSLLNWFGYQVKLDQSAYLDKDWFPIKNHIS